MSKPKIKREEWIALLEELKRLPIRYDSERDPREQIAEWLTTRAVVKGWITRA